MIFVLPIQAHTAGNIYGKVSDAKSAVPLVGVRFKWEIRT
jgi:hypothetical protein